MSAIAARSCYNFPVIEDTLAIRLVGYADHDGGFIDNVYGHTPDQSVFNGPDFFPSGFGTLDNSNSVEDRWNDSDVYGLRASVLWNINDNWNATFNYIGQKPPPAPTITTTLTSVTSRSSAFMMSGPKTTLTSFH